MKILHKYLNTNFGNFSLIGLPIGISMFIIILNLIVPFNDNFRDMLVLSVIGLLIFGFIMFVVKELIYDV